MILVPVEWRRVESTGLARDASTRCQRVFFLWTKWKTTFNRAKKRQKSGSNTATDTPKTSNGHRASPEGFDIWNTFHLADRDPDRTGTQPTEAPCNRPSKTRIAPNTSRCWSRHHYEGRCWSNISQSTGDRVEFFPERRTGTRASTNSESRFVPSLTCA